MILEKSISKARKSAHRNDAISEVNSTLAIPSVFAAWLIYYPSISKELKAIVNVGNLTIFRDKYLTFYLVSRSLPLIVLIMGFILRGWTRS